MSHHRGKAFFVNVKRRELQKEARHHRRLKANGWRLKYKDEFGGQAINEGDLADDGLPEIRAHVGRGTDQHKPEGQDSPG